MVDKVWVIFEFQLESSPYYEGPGGLCRFKICTAIDILEEFIQDWTVPIAIQKGIYSWERTKFDGKRAFINKEANSLIIIEEKEISNGYTI